LFEARKLGFFISFINKRLLKYLKLIKQAQSSDPEIEKLGARFFAFSKSWRSDFKTIGYP